MSEIQQESDWWLATDGKWYPPQSHPSHWRTAGAGSSAVTTNPGVPPNSPEPPAIPVAPEPLPALDSPAPLNQPDPPTDPTTVVELQAVLDLAAMGEEVLAKADDSIDAILEDFDRTLTGAKWTNETAGAWLQLDKAIAHEAIEAASRVEAIRQDLEAIQLRSDGVESLRAAYVTHLAARLAQLDRTITEPTEWDTDPEDRIETSWIAAVRAAHAARPGQSSDIDTKIDELFPLEDLVDDGATDTIPGAERISPVAKSAGIDPASFDRVVRSLATVGSAGVVLGAFLPWATVNILIANASVTGFEGGGREDHGRSRRRSGHRRVANALGRSSNDGRRRLDRWAHWHRRPGGSNPQHVQYSEAHWRASRRGNPCTRQRGVRSLGDAWVIAIAASGGGLCGVA